MARGGQTGRRNPQGRAVARRRQPRGSGALPGGGAPGRHARAAAGLPPPKLARPSAPRLGAVSWEQAPRELLGAFRILSP